MLQIPDLLKACDRAESYALADYEPGIQLFLARTEAGRWGRMYRMRSSGRRSGMEATSNEPDGGGRR